MSHVEQKENQFKLTANRILGKGSCSGKRANVVGSLIPRLLGLEQCVVRLLTVVLIVICMNGLAIAQNTNSADIRGTVTDVTGAAVPEVSVSLLNTDTGVTTTLVTNSA